MAVRQLSQQERRTKIKFNVPYKDAVDKFRRDALSQEDYDPGRLAVFSFMMARAVLEVLKAVEREFGEEGQRVATEAIRKVGREVAEQTLKDVEIPKDMTPIEVLSTWVTWLNEVFYASVEEPSIDSYDEASFHIHWCPLQDIYSPLDCRVQRYFVEGQMRAAEKITADFHAAFDFGIPQGFDTCHFHMWKKEPEEAEWSVWEEYTRKINARGLSESREGR